ncbi:MAG: (Fe-S)-binding protein, partial [Candidatus Puniceispirillaceae bacterium]
YEAEDFDSVLDWAAWPGAAGGFQGAVEMCNNNGACRKLTGGVMCPSYRATRNERDAVRGRANSLRLAMSGQLGPDAMASDAMAETMKLCVSCKACKRECPVGVDMARMKVEVTAARAAKHGIPLHDRLIGNLPAYAPLASGLSGLSNLVQSVWRYVPGLASLVSRLTGFTTKRSLPKWHSNAFRNGEIGSAPTGAGTPVVLFADTFNRYFEPENLRAAIRVLRAAGYDVFAPTPAAGRPYCCGRTYLSAGMVDKARAEAERLVTALYPLARSGVRIVGLEPSCTLALRDEVPALLGTAQAEAVAEATLTFAELIEADRPDLPVPAAAARRPVKLHGHCHQKAFDLVKPAEAVLRDIAGAEVEVIETSCCGMAGAFGYGRDTYDVSIRMAEASLLPAVRAAPNDAAIVADGTSCRCQIDDGTGREVVHLARHLDRLISGS